MEDLLNVQISKDMEKINVCCPICAQDVEVVCGKLDNKFHPIVLNTCEHSTISTNDEDVIIYFELIE